MARHRSMAGALSLLLVFLFLMFVIPVQAQQAQPYVGRFTGFTGFSYMASPSFNLYQRGFDGDFGVNVKRWFSLGVDFSVLDGNTSILPKELTPSLQAALGAEIGALGGLPPGYTLYVPFNGKTYTVAAGPQINFRQLKRFTFFVRPGLGAIHEHATLKPRDTIQTIIVSSLAPSSPTCPSSWAPIRSPRLRTSSTNCRSTSTSGSGRSRPSSTAGAVEWISMQASTSPCA